MTKSQEDRKFSIFSDIVIDVAEMLDTDQNSAAKVVDLYPSETRRAYSREITPEQAARNIVAAYC